MRDPLRGLVPPEALDTWDDYVGAERDRIRPRLVPALEAFIARFGSASSDARETFALALARAAERGESGVSVRLPMFRDVVFPALREKVSRGDPEAARLLASFGVQFQHVEAQMATLPEDLRSELGLLRRARAGDPSDRVATTKLVDLLESQLAYAIHEVPAGVLYGSKGATAAQCDELLADLQELVDASTELGVCGEHDELIEACSLHFRAYRAYLTGEREFDSYAAFLEARAPRST